MRKIVKKIILMALVFIFVFTAAPANHVEAAKKPQLKTTKVTERPLSPQQSWGE